MTRYPHLAARLFNTPLLVHPQKLDAIIAGLGERILGDGPLPEMPQAESRIPAELFTTRRGERSEGGYQMIDGVAVIGINGALVHKSRMEADSSFLLGYNTIATQLDKAAADSAVKAVLLMIDSPGGEVQGAFELAERIMALRGKKPVWAMVDGMGASAAYLLAAATDRIVISRTGWAGSIGVVMRHVDMTGAAHAAGLRITHIFAGAHKVDGNQFAELSPAVRADMQREIDALYAEFVAFVATARGISADAVRATEARTYRGAEAVSAGLVDAVGTADETIAELAALRPARSNGQPARNTANSKGGKYMEGNPEMAGNEQQPVLTQADVDAARAAGLEQGRAEGAKAERERIAAVEAQALPGHESLIAQLKFDGKTSGHEAAVQVLQAERASAQKRAADLAADAPKPVAFDADNSVEATAPARKDPNALAEQIAAKQAEAATRGQKLSAAQALQLVKKEADHG